jgi:hypothetical protein
MQPIKIITINISFQVVNKSDVNLIDRIENRKNVDVSEIINSLRSIPIVLFLYGYNERTNERTNEQTDRQREMCW